MSDDIEMMNTSEREAFTRGLQALSDWRKRAEKAEAQVARLREALKEFVDELQTGGSEKKILATARAVLEETK